MQKPSGFAFYRKLFCSTFYLSAFTFGGGYVIIPLMRKKFVEDYHWIEEKEILDLTAIAQSSPGAIAVNAAVIIGYRLAGILGALVALVGTVLPPLIIISVISLFYQAFRDNVVVNAVLKGMQAGVAAVIADVTASMAIGIGKEKKLIPILIMIAAFIANYFLNVNVIIIILVCAVVGALALFWQQRRGKNNLISQMKQAGAAAKEETAAGKAPASAATDTKPERAATARQAELHEGGKHHDLS